MEPTSEKAQTQLATIMSGGVPSFYVEGLSQMLVGFPNSRMMLHTMVQKDAANPDGPEIRQLACELVIPTTALVEMAQNILLNLKANKDGIQSLKAEWSKKVDILMDAL